MSRMETRNAIFCEDGKNYSHQLEVASKQPSDTGCDDEPRTDQIAKVRMSQPHQSSRTKFLYGSISNLYGSSSSFLNSQDIIYYAVESWRCHVS